ncbi:RICIN domain-containing protein [Kitasatospora sp. NPDC001527]|uniref:RICIN domain-containing protein n=1 Tax=Kitasatospora sp. NPDC001527 TaxID=3154519 RepID=UPI003318F48A
MTDPAPTNRRRLGAALGALATAAAVVMTAPGTAHAGRAHYFSPYFEIRNVATGKCLEVADWRTDDRAPVRQWTCTGGANQLWSNSNYGLLKNKNSGKCLDVPYSSTVWGTQPIQWSCADPSNLANQTWSVPGVNRPSPNTVYTQLGLVLDVYGYDPSDGAPVVTWGANGGDNQLWIGLDPQISLPRF